jgi:hypothetical protein
MRACAIVSAQTPFQSGCMKMAGRFAFTLSS